MDRYQSTILCHFIGLADSHITHPHLSQTFTIVVTVVEIAGFRLLISVSGSRVEAGCAPRPRLSPTVLRPGVSVCMR